MANRQNYGEVYDEDTSECLSAALPVCCVARALVGFCAQTASRSLCATGTPFSAQSAICPCAALLPTSPVRRLLLATDAPYVPRGVPSRGRLRILGCSRRTRAAAARDGPVRAFCRPQGARWAWRVGGTVILRAVCSQAEEVPDRIRRGGRAEI